MSDKKSLNRFTIQFNTRDSTHQKVIEILNLQGRKKAQYIVNAILSYESGAIKSADIDDDIHHKIAAIVEQVLAGRVPDKKPLLQTDGLKSDKKVLKSDAGLSDIVQYDFSDDDFNIISGMIDEFKVR